MPSATDSLCPCGSELPLEQCCAPILSGETPAPTAEALMRSRFSAFALNKIPYLGATLSEELAQEFNAEEMTKLNKGIRWTSLEVHETSQGGPDDEYGEVVFTASFMRKGKLGRLQERSLFSRREGRWVYSGRNDEQPHPAEITAGPKAGRNEPCPCGSGRKFKKCCGR